MPIDVDRFTGAPALADLPTSARLVRYLYRNADKAFTRRELADAVGADPETVGTNLTRLKDRGLVRHRSPYWASPASPSDVLADVRDRFSEDFVADLTADTDLERGQRPPTDQSTSRDGAREMDRPPERAGTESEPVDSHRRVAREFRRRVQEELGDDVASLYLFGSVAEEAATPDSDVDILAVISDDAGYTAVDDTLLGIAYDLQLTSGLRVEVHSLPERQFEARREWGDPFIDAVLSAGAPHD